MKTLSKTTIPVIMVFAIFLLLFCKKDKDNDNDPVNEKISAPTILNAQVVSYSKVNLSWQDNSDNETGFKIERSAGNNSAFERVANINADVTSYLDTGLVAEKSYKYRVLAFNSEGASNFSNVANVTTPAKPAETLSSPTNLVANVVSDGQINISWADNSTGESGFKVERATGSDGQFVEIITLQANSVNYQNTGLIPSTTYKYRVCAFKNTTVSGFSNVATATTKDIEYSAPGISGPETSTGTFTISVTYSWGILGTNRDHYEIEESVTSANSGFQIINKSPEGSHVSPYNVIFTKTAGTYYYRARIFKASPYPGYSKYSTVIKVVVSAPVRKVKLVNNMSTSLNIHDIVQFKVARYENAVKTRSDLLTPDPAECLALPGESISPGGSRSFNITIGPNYSTFIGIGIWDLNSFTCSRSRPWFKRRFFTTPQFETYYVWTIVNVNGHNNGEWVWTISGNYLNATLTVTPNGQRPIVFNRTTINPIP